MDVCVYVCTENTEAYAAISSKLGTHVTNNIGQNTDGVRRP